MSPYLKPKLRAEIILIVWMEADSGFDYRLVLSGVASLVMNRWSQFSADLDGVGAQIRFKAV